MIDSAIANLSDNPLVSHLGDLCAHVNSIWAGLVCRARYRLVLQDAVDRHADVIALRISHAKDAYLVPMTIPKPRKIHTRRRGRTI